MAVAIGIWSLELIPGKPETIQPEADLRIVNASFGDLLKDPSGRTTVKFTYQVPAGILDDEDDEDDEVSQASKTTILCSLKPDTFEQASTDIVLQEDEEYTFEVIGQNTVYLTGNYIDQAVNNPPFMDTDEMESDDDEDAYDLREVSSDVEMHPDDLLSDSGRFEEVEEVPKTLKRPREADVEADTVKLSKSEKKKQKKKQKGENGKPIEKPVEENKLEEKEEETKQDKQEVADNKKSKQKPTESKKPKNVEREITGGVKLIDAKLGTGPMAKKGNTVGMRYIGKLQNGKVFDKNVSGKPFIFHLGKGEVIKGWDEGIVGMQVGGERKITIPPEMAYGKKAMGDIPKNSTLVFDVRLVEIK